ncbi:hypothetical protein [Candidatus Spongiihabitans sp.]|uniref:hypothetical protein n=1 Tax=Candidatus Spongiihabitans sp. TaxID=3101308 RepID=UPI003C6F67DD
MSDPDTEFSILLKINIEVEENGTVISTYFFDDEIRIRGKYKGWERQGVSYQKLIKKYRNRLFRELDFYFLGR